MDTSQIYPARVTTPDAKLVRSAKSLLAKVAAADDGEMAQWLFDTLLDRAERSLRYTDAAFLATQMLRDSGTIEPAEAIYVFDSLWNRWMERYRDADEQVERAAARLKAGRRRGLPASDDVASFSTYTAVLDRREVEMLSEFLDARGEEALAKLVASDHDAYRDLCAQGSSLVEEKHQHA